MARPFLAIRDTVRMTLLLLFFAPAYAQPFEVSRFETDFVRLDIVEERLVATDEQGERRVLGLRDGRLLRSTYESAQPAARPDDILADGVVVTGRQDIRQAWLGGATTRYDHAVLGDGREASRLYVIDRNGRRHELELSNRYVFEDRYPRLIELDEDRGAEIALIRSHVDRGAAVAVYGLRNGELTEIAASEPIGLRHRWLNIVGAGDFDGDGGNEIAVVITPHIGGTLTLLRPEAGKLVPVFRRDGFSNHEYGSRELGMSAVMDLDGDGTPDLAVPDTRRESLVLLSLARGRYRELDRIEHRAVIKSALHPVDLDRNGKRELAYLLADRTLVLVETGPR